MSGAKRVASAPKFDIADVAEMVRRNDPARYERADKMAFRNGATAAEILDLALEMGIAALEAQQRLVGKPKP